MTLTAGTRLGPYEIHSLVGAGGMGEVYRAKDSRIGRDVAVKVLPRSLTTDAELLQRFEQEARAAGQLNHPNILVIYDVGLADGTPYIVTELLGGETLRERLDAGPLPPREVVEVAEQIAAGLAAAHARGIVHRDLKPENLFLLADGHVKILDFGIAKLTRTEGVSGGDTRTVPASLTATGAIIGTASYMAPEQIRGRPTDHRADLFALGAIVYELLTGRKAFEGETPADRMSAILTSDPPPLGAEFERAVPGLTLVIRRCLEKRPDARFDSARDLAFTLRLLLESASQRTAPAAGVGAPGKGEITFHRLTFREGTIDRAQFAPDGQTVVFGASWEGEPLGIYLTRLGSPEARPLGPAEATILGVSSSGEMAVSLRPRDMGGFIQLGVLARLPLMGGAPRELTTDVMDACWSPDGRSLAVIHLVDGTFRLEYPIGKVLYQTAGWIGSLHVSPDGRRVAFLDHPARGNNSGNVMEVDAEGRVRTIAKGYQTLWRLVHSPGGDEVWFSGNLPGGSTCIFAANREGAVRSLHPMPGFTAIEDLSHSGHALLNHATFRMRMEARARDGGDATELSWLEWSLVRDVSPDGKWVLFDETGTGGGEGHSVYLRSTAGGSAIRLGDGLAARFSPDGAWVMAIEAATTGRVLLLPVGAGESIPLEWPGYSVQSGGWIPGTKQLCLAASQENGPLRAYRFDLETRILTPISEEALRTHHLNPTPDGRAILAVRALGQYALFPVDGSEPRPLDWIGPMERPIRFSDDGTHLFLSERSRLPAPIHRVEVATGRRETWFELHPRQRSGVASINAVSASADGNTFAYSYVQQLSDLHVVEGLR